MNDTTTKQIAAPKHLQSETQKWFEKMIAAHPDLLECGRQEQFTLACEALDRCRQARDVINEEGLTQLDRYGNSIPRAEVAIQLKNRASFGQILKSLDLKAPPKPRAGTVGPRIRQ